VLSFKHSIYLFYLFVLLEFKGLYIVLKLVYNVIVKNEQKTYNF